MLHAGKDTAGHLGNGTLVPRNAREAMAQDGMLHAGKDTAGHLSNGSLVPRTHEVVNVGKRMSAAPRGAVRARTATDHDTVDTRMAAATSHRRKTAEYHERAARGAAAAHKVLGTTEYQRQFKKSPSRSRTIATDTHDDPGSPGRVIAARRRKGGENNPPKSRAAAAPPKPAAGKKRGDHDRPKPRARKSEYDAEYDWPEGVPRHPVPHRPQKAVPLQSNPPAKPNSSRRWESEYDDEFEWPAVMPTDTLARPTAEKQTVVAPSELEPVRGLHPEFSFPTTECVNL